MCACNKHVNFKEGMWKLKLKVCLINFLAYSFCILFLYLCFHKKAPYRQDFGPTAIDYMYKLEGENSGFSPSAASLPEPLPFRLNACTDALRPAIPYLRTPCPENRFFFPAHPALLYKIPFKADFRKDRLFNEKQIKL